MDVFSNTFCAAGTQLGNGTWAVFGGNKPVTTGGKDATGPEAYHNLDGGTAIRMLNADDSGSADYIQGAVTYDITQDTGGWLQMTSKRWYPTTETLGDGTIVIIGGDINGGYVNTPYQDNPTYEFFPPREEGAINLQFLTDTLPLNLYALVWLMPSGNLFMQANRKSILYNLTSRATTEMQDMPYAARVYPASAASVMLPLTPRNGYTPTLLFCGGSANTEWGNDGGPGFNITAFPADKTCVRISPEVASPYGSDLYEDDDNMLEGRSMGELILLPDGNIWVGNGVAMGSAGYGDNHYSVGTSFGQDPLYTPAVYYPENPAGKRWDRTGFQPSQNERMYHSTANLLPDGSILVAGSNPNADFTDEQWRSRTDVDRWYPAYYNEPRPQVTAIPDSISYGGAYFNISLDSTTNLADVNNTRVVIHRNGFHTHCVGFGQRMLELESSFTIDHNANTTTLHVSNIPGGWSGPNLFQPGHAFLFVVVNGVPSWGTLVMVGNGQLGQQPTAENAPLPQSTVIEIEETVEPSATEAGKGGKSSTTAQTAANANSASSLAPVMAGSMAAVVALIVSLM
jgi:hypothetical protein